jgi:ribosomal protein L7/L12
VPTDSERISALERRVAELEHNLRELAGAPMPHAGPGEHPGDMLEMIRAGQKINAIKRYRELYGVGLAEAKTAVEALEEQLRRR